MVLEARTYSRTTLPGDFMSGYSDIYFDNLGLIVQRDGDGGDTAQREGWAWFGSYIRAQVLNRPWELVLPIEFQQTMDLLELGRTGQFRRHPTQGGWKSDPDQFSRDQIIPLIAALGVWGDTSRVARSWGAFRPCHLVLTCVQGTADIAGPELLNLYRRALGQMPDPHGDSLLAAGVANRLAQTQHDPNDVGDDINLVVYLLASKLFSPTVISQQAADLYSKNRPVCAGCYLDSYRQAYPGDMAADEPTMLGRISAGIAAGWQVDCTRVLGAIRWYFRSETGACSALGELYEPIIEAFLS